MQLSEDNKSKLQSEECFLSSQKNDAVTENKSAKEKLHFLLQVASDPTLAKVSQQLPQASLSDLARNSTRALGVDSPTKNEAIDDEEIKKQRRIQYALSVLSSSREESEARMQRAILEAKQRRVQRVVSSLTKKSSSSSSSVPSVSPNSNEKLKRHSGHISACRTFLLAGNSIAAQPSVKHSEVINTNSGGKMLSEVMRENAPVKKNNLKRPLVQIAPEHHLASSCTTSMKKARHNRKGTFPEKLMDVLSRKDTENAIVWLPDGKSFEIVSPEIFVAEVLPRFFKQAKFQSFTRKLNRWGFTRITKGTNSIAFSHESFVRGKPELCKEMGGGKRYEAEEPEAKRQEALRNHMGVIAGMNTTQKTLDKIPLASMAPYPLMVPASPTSLLQRSCLNYPKHASESIVAQETMNRAIIAASMTGVNDVKLSGVTGKSNVQLSLSDKKYGSLQPDLAPKSQLLSQQNLLGFTDMNVPDGNLVTRACTNEALSYFYEPKMHDISARYNNQGAILHRGNLSQPVHTLAAQMPNMSNADRKSYLHRIRLLPPQNVITSSVSSSAPSSHRPGGAA